MLPMKLLTHAVAPTRRASARPSFATANDRAGSTSTVSTDWLLSARNLVAFRPCSSASRPPVPTSAIPSSCRPRFTSAEPFVISTSARIAKCSPCSAGPRISSAARTRVGKPARSGSSTGQRTLRRQRDRIRTHVGELDHGALEQREGLVHLLGVHELGARLLEDTRERVAVVQGAKERPGLLERRV